MTALYVALVAAGIQLVLGLAASIRIFKQYERGMQFRDRQLRSVSRPRSWSAGSAGGWTTTTGRRQ